MAPQTDEANLARIRDNQRRSRARRKEYLQELEQRVRVYEEQGVEASTEVQQAARRVAEENRRLRALLRHHGITHNDTEAYLRSGIISVSGTAVEVVSRTGPVTDSSHVQAVEQIMVPRMALKLGTTAAILSGSCMGDGSSASRHNREMSTPTSGSVASRESSLRDLDTTQASPPAASSSMPTCPQSQQSLSNLSSSAGANSGTQAQMLSALPFQSPPGTTTALTVTTAGEGDYTQNNYAHSFLQAGPAYTLGGSRSSTPAVGGIPFYGLEATSAEDLQYASEPSFFDYSVSPHFLGTAGSQQQQQQHQQRHQQHPQHQQHQHQHQQRHGQANGSGATASQTPSYFGGVTGLVAAGGGTAAYVRPCGGCMSGLGCQVHGSYYEE